MWAFDWSSVDTLVEKLFVELAELSERHCGLQRAASAQSKGRTQIQARAAALLWLGRQSGPLLVRSGKALRVLTRRLRWSGVRLRFGVLCLDLWVRYAEAIRGVIL